jgi:hypothetical protein
MGVSLFKVEKWKQKQKKTLEAKQTLISKWIAKMLCNIHSVEHYATDKKNELELYQLTYTDLLLVGKSD